MMNLAEEAIRNWELERAGVIAELENIPEEHFDFRPEPGARSLRELAVHVAEAGLFFAAEILRADGSFLHFFEPADDSHPPAAHSKADVLALLRAAGSETAARLRRVGEDLPGQTMQTFHGVESRLTALWFVVGHEMYHCGQLATYARALGRVPALTRRLAAIQSDEAAGSTV